MTHQCDAIRCLTTVAVGKFMCIKHWRMVQVPVQDTINERYRACRRDFAFLSDRAYLEACVRAVESIAKLEGIQGVQSTYHRLLRQVDSREKRNAA